MNKSNNYSNVNARTIQGEKENHFQRYLVLLKKIWVWQYNARILRCST